MPKILEARQTWTFTGSTAVAKGKAIQLSPSVDRLTVYFVTSSGCTATIALQTCAESSAGPWVNMEASTAMSTGATLLKQYVGPLGWVRPALDAMKASTDVVTVYLLAN